MNTVLETALVRAAQANLEVQVAIAACLEKFICTTDTSPQVSESIFALIEARVHCENAKKFLEEAKGE